jgi:hypothetical protein
MSAAARSAFPMLRQAITTLWPLSAAAAAVAVPTPLLPPVTMIRISADRT